MSDLIKDFAQFLTERRNNSLTEICNNKRYLELKRKSLDLSEKLMLASSAHEHSLLMDLFDSITGMGSVETNFYYLCGVRDWGKSEKTLNLSDEAIPYEINSRKQYSTLKEMADKRLNELRKILSTENCAVLDECLTIKSSILGVEKKCCYNSGLCDRKLLDELLRRTSGDVCNELLDAFI